MALMGEASQSVHVADTSSFKKLEATMQLLPTIARAVKLSQDLPASNTPSYVYYNDFPQYRAITSGQSKMILSTMQSILDILDAKANILDSPVPKTLREKFSSIIDANDRILEKMAVAMDFEENPERKSSEASLSKKDLVVAVHRTNSTSLEWLKSKNLPESISLENSTPENLLRLLSSKHVSRPQTSFSLPPDNSSTPFRPLLTKKPNSVVSLDDSLAKMSTDSEEYPHPYQAELEAFGLTLSDWTPLKPEEFTSQPLENTFHFIDTVEKLKDSIESFANCKELAVDLEHHSYRSFLGITCLVQISTREADYVIDALALRDHLSCLNIVFTDPSVTKVFHGSDSDLMWLQRDFGVYVINLFDTGLAARLLRLGRFSLSYLLQRYVGITSNKQYQLADWRMRPLPDELIEYARTDTHYLLYIAASMCQELQDRNLLSTVLERGRQLCFKLYTKPAFDPLGYLNLYKQTGGISFSHRQIYALENLYALRDSIARREDESIHYVLPNHMLKVIAEVLPREVSGLFACCNPIPPLVRKYVHDLHKIVLDARNRPISDLVLTTDQFGMVPVNLEDSTQSTSCTFPSITNPVMAPPHDYSHVLKQYVNDPCSMQNKQKLRKKPSAFAHEFTASSKILTKTDENGVSSENLKFAEPSLLLLKKIIELLKLPCPPLILSNNANQSINVPSGVTANNSAAEELIKFQPSTVQDKDDIAEFNLIKNVESNIANTEQQSVTNVETSNSMLLNSFDLEKVVLLCNEKESKTSSSKKNRRSKTFDNQLQPKKIQKCTDQEQVPDVWISTECTSSSDESNKDENSLNMHSNVLAHLGSRNSYKSAKKSRGPPLRRRKHQI